MNTDFILMIFIRVYLRSSVVKKMEINVWVI